MQIIIKGKHNLKISEDLKAYIEEKVSPVLEGLKEPTICEVKLEDIKSGKDSKIMKITSTVADIKKPVYVDEASNDFFKTVDLIADKFSRAMHNAKR